MTGKADYFMNLMRFSAENDLSNILPSKLYLSGRSVPQNPSLLIANNITHVLSVTRVRHVLCVLPPNPLIISPLFCPHLVIPSDLIYDLRR